MDEKTLELKKEITRDVLASFLGDEDNVAGQYGTKLIVNRKYDTNVYSVICKQLRNCDEFYFNVAFITDDGLIMLKHTIEECKCKGKIITSDYLAFNSPKTFRELLKLKDKNIDIRIYSKENFHAKGYIFKNGNEYKALIGSSNLTGNALKKNTEWNVLTSSYSDGSFIKEIIDEFNDEWNNETVELTNEWIDNYAIKYESSRKFIEGGNDYIRDICAPKPNHMQIEALNNLTLLRENGESKALLISATGTGKTYLSAFDAYNFNPHKLLFIAHRGKLLNDALKSFKNIFGDISSSIYKGSNKDKNGRLVFASIQTLSKQENLMSFKEDEFDYIVVDEAHHSCGQTYEKVLNYFKPKFLLGMTATPERMDGGNIFSFFDHNIAYEIRLNDALEYNLLCPFHYFGINDFTIDKEEKNIKDFSKLVNNQRVDLVMEKANYYGFSGDRVKGLIFVSRLKEAKELSLLFNQKGWKCDVVSGEESEEEREKKIESLESDDIGSLDYIISVDVLNEGIDIPSVNQIIMLRPTQSAIVFVHQLGRGLRKTDSKKYVVVLDFIANYDNNYLIPIALSGDKSYQKENYRRFINEADVSIPGIATVEFDEVVKEKIFKQINTQNKIGTIETLKREYFNLKNMLGRIPNYDDFLKCDTFDLNLIFKYKDFWCYHEFLKKYDKEDYKVDFNETEVDFIRFVSCEFGDGKRMDELCYIENIINGKAIKFGDSPKDRCIEKYLNGSFLQQYEKDRYHHNRFLDEDGSINKTFELCLKNNEFINELKKIIAYAKAINLKKYTNVYRKTDLVLYKRYTRKDVCRLLNWNQNENAQNIGGYKYDTPSNTMAVYVTYNKDIQNTKSELMYEDEFIDPKMIVCISKNKRDLNSPEIIRLKDQVVSNLKVHLFVNKIKGETDFYYLGEINYKDSEEVKEKKNVRITYTLDTPCKDSVYDYLTTKIVDE